MERFLGYIIGAVVALLIVSAIAVLFGGAVIGALSAIIAFPLAAPMTTAALCVALIWGYIAFRRKRRTRDQP